MLQKGLAEKVAIDVTLEECPGRCVQTPRMTTSSKELETRDVSTFKRGRMGGRENAAKQSSVLGKARALRLSRNSTSREPSKENLCGIVLSGSELSPRVSSGKEPRLEGEGQQQLWIGAAKDGSGLVPLNDTFNGEVEVQHAKVMELSAAGTTAAKSFSRDSAEVCSFELIERDKEQPWRSLKGFCCVDPVARKHLQYNATFPIDFIDNYVTDRWQDPGGLTKEEMEQPDAGRLVGFDKKFWPSTGVAISMVHNGFRLGKTTDGSGDLRVVSTPNGLVKSSVIRRTPKPWNPVYTSMVTDLPYKLTEVQKERAKDCSWTCSRTQNVERYAVDHGDSEEEQPTMDMGQPNQQETEFEQTPSSKKNFKTLVSAVVNDYQWEQDLYDDLDDEEMALENFENEEYEDIEELTRTPEPYGKLLSTRSVFDWRPAQMPVFTQDLSVQIIFRIVWTLLDTASGFGSSAELAYVRSGCSLLVRLAALMTLTVPALVWVLRACVRRCGLPGLANALLAAQEKYALSAADFTPRTDAKLDQFAVESRTGKTVAEQRPTAPTSYCVEAGDTGESGSGAGATLPIGDLMAKNKLGGCDLASSLGLGQQLVSSGFGLLNMLASSGFGVLGMVAKGSYSGGTGITGGGLWIHSLCHGYWFVEMSTIAGCNLLALELELHWRFVGELKEELRKIKKLAGRESMTLEDLKFYALMPNDKGNPSMKLLRRGGLKRMKLEGRESTAEKTALVKFKTERTAEELERARQNLLVMKVELVKRTGRWTSSAVQRYLRDSVDVLAGLAKKMDEFVFGKAVDRELKVLGNKLLGKAQIKVSEDDLKAEHRHGERELRSALRALGPNPVESNGSGALVDLLVVGLQEELASTQEACWWLRLGQCGGWEREELTGIADTRAPWLMDDPNVLREKKRTTMTLRECKRPYIPQRAASDALKTLKDKMDHVDTQPWEELVTEMDMLGNEFAELLTLAEEEDRIALEQGRMAARGFVAEHGNPVSEVIPSKEELEKLVSVLNAEVDYWKLFPEPRGFEDFKAPIPEVGTYGPVLEGCETDWQEDCAGQNHQSSRLLVGCSAMQQLGLDQSWITNFVNLPDNRVRARARSGDRYMGKDGDVDDTKVDTPPKRGDALGDWSTPQGMIQAVKKAKGLGKAIPRELAQALASTLKGMKGKGKGLHQGERETAMPSFEPVASSGWLHTKRLGKQNHHSAENKRDEVEAIEDSQPSCDGEKRKPEPTDEETPDKRAEVPKRMKKKIPDQEEAEAVPEESKQKKKKKKDEELDENGEALNGKESQAKKKKKPIADEADADLEMEPPKMKKPKNDGGVSGDRLHDGPKKKRGDAHDDKEEAQPRKAKVPRGIQAEEPEAEVMTPTEKQAKRKEKNKKANEIQEGDMADLSKQMETEAMQVAMYGSVPIDVAEGEEGGQDLDGEELDLEDWEHQELLVDDREGVPSQGLMDVEGMSAEAIREAKSTPAKEEKNGNSDEKDDKEGGQQNQQKTTVSAAVAVNSGDPADAPDPEVVAAKKAALTSKVDGMRPLDQRPDGDDSSSTASSKKGKGMLARNCRALMAMRMEQAMVDGKKNYEIQREYESEKSDVQDCAGRWPTADAWGREFSEDYEILKTKEEWVAVHGDAALTRIPGFMPYRIPYGARASPKLFTAKVLCHGGTTQYCVAVIFAVVDEMQQDYRAAGQVS
ncbi:unnamed protein product [Durusdinium trenchii]|uniref:Uncharacterized protein n=1 Tax=Durusdinium trenchii TaxID=1381693 RepID=A0ABP0KMN4_9DINO